MLFSKLHDIFSLQSSPIQIVVSRWSILLPRHNWLVHDGFVEFWFVFGFRLLFSNLLLKLRFTRVSCGILTLVSDAFQICWDLQLSLYLGLRRHQWLCGGYSLVVDAMFCCCLIGNHWASSVQFGLIRLEKPVKFIVVYFTRVVGTCICQCWQSKHLPFYKRLIWFFKFVSDSFRMLAVFYTFFFYNLVLNFVLGLLVCAMCIYLLRIGFLLIFIRCICFTY